MLCPSSMQTHPSVVFQQERRPPNRGAASTRTQLFARRHRKTERVGPDSSRPARTPSRYEPLGVPGFRKYPLRNWSLPQVLTGRPVSPIHVTGLPVQAPPQNSATFAEVTTWGGIE